MDANKIVIGMFSLFFHLNEVYRIFYLKRRDQKKMFYVVCVALALSYAMKLVVTVVTDVFTSTFKRFPYHP